MKTLAQCFRILTQIELDGCDYFRPIHAPLNMDLDVKKTFFAFIYFMQGTWD